MPNETLVKVFDDVLSESHYQAALEDIRGGKLAATLSSINPMSDGFAFRGSPNTGFDDGVPWQRQLSQFLRANAGVQAEEFNWRATFYPPGSGISWHLDQGDGRSYAFNFYCMSSWEIDWGGELVYLNQSVSSRLKLSKTAIASQGGDLSLIYPKPNRLALIYPGCAHRVMPVSERAGDRHRSAWTGFAF